MGAAFTCCSGRPLEEHEAPPVLRLAPGQGQRLEAPNDFSKYDYSTPLFSIVDEGMRRPARLVGAHDGDTVSVVIKINNKASKFNVRLDGIDTPEITSMDPKIKGLAVEARNRLVSYLTRGQVILPIDGSRVTRNFINAKICEKVHVVFLECRGMDKYGRVLAKIYLDESADAPSANRILLDEGLAKPYSGGTKSIWVV